VISCFTILSSTVCGDPTETFLYLK
jgi:hypothetical protein